MPSIASDSARTLTSPPPPLHRLVIFLFLFFLTPLPSVPLSSAALFLHLTFFSPIPVYPVRPLPPTPVIFHPSLSLHFPPFFHRPSFMSLSSSIVLWEHLLSLPASAIFYLGLSSSPPRLSISLLSLQSIFCLPASLKGAQTTSTGLIRLHSLLFNCLTWRAPRSPHFLMKINSQTDLSCAEQGVCRRNLAASAAL